MCRAIGRLAPLFAALLALACSSASPENGPPSVADASHPTSDAGHSRDAGSGDVVRRDAKASHPTTDGAVSPPTQDAAKGEAGDASADAGDRCSVDGESGQCMTVTACAALGDHISTPGYCPGPASIECCRVTPNVADNPPTPAGWELMQQSQVTPAMTTWAVSILNDPTDYPMFATTTQWFGTLDVLARVEWHPPDSNNSAVHRGVTLYEPIPDGG